MKFFTLIIVSILAFACGEVVQQERGAEQPINSTSVTGESMRHEIVETASQIISKDELNPKQITGAKLKEDENKVQSSEQ